MMLREDTHLELNYSDYIRVARLLALGFFFWFVFAALDYGLEFILAEPEHDEISSEVEEPSEQQAQVLPYGPEEFAVDPANDQGFLDPPSVIEPGLYGVQGPLGQAKVLLGDELVIAGGKKPTDTRRPILNHTSGSKVRGFLHVPENSTEEPRPLPTPEEQDGVISPGLYSTPFHVQNCSYELRALVDGERIQTVGQEFLSRGRVLVLIDDVEPDWFESSTNCHQWMPWQPLQHPLTSLVLAGNGDYWKADLAQGTWEVPEPCTWSKVTAFRGASLTDVVAVGGPETSLIIDEATLGVRIRGCITPEFPYRTSTATTDEDQTKPAPTTNLGPRDQPVVLERNIGPLSGTIEPEPAAVIAPLSLLGSN